MTELEQAQFLLSLAVEMRLAQVRYFRTRDRGDLITSKELERKFDEGVKRLRQSQDDARMQKELF